VSSLGRQKRCVSSAWRIAWMVPGLLWLCLLPAQAAAGDNVVLESSVNKTRVAVNETLKLTITASVPDRSKMGYLQLPETASLEIVGTSRRESLQFALSGGKANYQKFENTVLTLRPTRIGKVTIGPAELKYAGRLHKTKSITVLVGKARNHPSGPTSPFSGRPSSMFPDDDWFRSPMNDLMRRRQAPQALGSEDIFVRAYVPSDLVYEGQQITVSVYVYSRVGARIASIRWPKLDGFYAVDRDASKAKADEKVINGLRYQYKLLDRKALFPLRPGSVKIGAVEVEVEAGGSPFFPAENRVLKTRPLEIKVEALPKKGRPASFHSGNVGIFSLSAELDADRVTLNQPVTYTLTLKGTGNIERLHPPDLPRLDRFKTFDPTVQVKVPKTGKMVRGTKVFEYIMMPLASGELIIPALEFAFFEPASGVYKTLKVPERKLHVTASGGTAGGIGPGGREVNIVAGAMKPIRFESSLSGHGAPFYQHWVFAVLLVVPPGLFLLLLLLAWFRTGLMVESPRSLMRRAWSDARRRLKQAAKMAAAGQTVDFYATLNQALIDAIFARTGVAAGGLALDMLKQSLREDEVPEALCAAVGREIENCEFGRFAPSVSQAGEMQAALQRAAGLVKDLQRLRAPAAQGGRR